MQPRADAMVVAQGTCATSGLRVRFVGVALDTTVGELRLADDKELVDDAQVDPGRRLRKEIDADPLRVAVIRIDVQLPRVIVQADTVGGECIVLVARGDDLSRQRSERPTGRDGTGCVRPRTKRGMGLARMDF